VVCCDQNLISFYEPLAKNVNSKISLHISLFKTNSKSYLILFLLEPENMKNNYDTEMKIEVTISVSMKAYKTHENLVSSKIKQSQSNISEIIYIYISMIML